MIIKNIVTGVRKMVIAYACLDFSVSAFLVCVLVYITSNHFVVGAGPWRSQ